jgi:hypothetical protein
MESFRLSTFAILGVLLSPGFAVVCGGVWWWGNSRTEECPKMEKIISQVA